MKCEKCKKNMECLGNISGTIYLTLPAMWQEVFVCHSCKLKKTITVIDKSSTDHSYLNKYKEMKCP